MPELDELKVIDGLKNITLELCCYVQSC